MSLYRPLSSLLFKAATPRPLVSSFSLVRGVRPVRNFSFSNRLLATESKQAANASAGSRPRLTKEEYAQLVEQARIDRQRKGVQTSWYYSASVVVVFLTLSFAAVPFYRIVCQQSGFMGAPVSDSSKFTPDKLIPVDHHKRIRVSFSSNTSTSMPWKFTPQQREVKVLPGETALAFYKAKNPTNHDIIGMATYSVVPEKAAPYFSKIQCFCFEEQRLAAGEEVDMPVFFFIDPDFVNDPLMRNVDDIILNYTFFRARYDDDGVLKPVTGADALDLQLQRAPVKSIPAVE
ncbi:hypothetical protein DV495_004286 [Geotrichum candidum]|nr:hypothetical protein DV495_004286 [Geotrichum candidum]